LAVDLPASGARFQICSLSKQFAAAAVLLLADRGRVTLDTAGRRSYFHPGDNPGYLAFNAWLPDHGIRLAVLVNEETTI
jgi:hypothetical protein